MPESFFSTVAGLGSAVLLKKKCWHRCLPMNFAKFLRTPFLTEHLWWLLLYLYTWTCNLRILICVFKWLHFIHYLSALSSNLFFCLATPWPTVSQYWWDILTHSQFCSFIFSQFLTWRLLYFSLFTVCYAISSNVDETLYQPLC